MTERDTGEYFAVGDALYVVEGGERGVIDNLSSCFPWAYAEIHILRRIKDTFVQISNDIEKVAAEEPTCGDGVIHIGRMVERKSGKCVIGW